MEAEIFPKSLGQKGCDLASVSSPLVSLAQPLRSLSCCVCITNQQAKCQILQSAQYSLLRKLGQPRSIGCFCKILLHLPGDSMAVLDKSRKNSNLIIS